MITSNILLVCCKLCSNSDSSKKSFLLEKIYRCPLSMERILLISLFLLSLPLVRGDAELKLHEVSHSCSVDNGEYTDNKEYQKNLSDLFTNLFSQALNVSFYNSTAGEVPHKVYGLFQCREDLDKAFCSACVQDARHRILEVCSLLGEANLWYEECMLRFANRSIFSLAEEEGHPWTSGSLSSGNVSNYGQFAPVLASTMSGLIDNAAFGTPSKHFATREANLSSSETLYSLAQCTPDINGNKCKSCLQTAFKKMYSCCNARSRAAVFMLSCQLRYDNSSFYNLPGKTLPVREEPPPPENAPPAKNLRPPKKPHGKLAVIIMAVAAMLLFLIIWSWLHWRKVKKRPGHMHSRALNETLYGDRDEIKNVESLQYDFSIIKAATHNFSEDNKLGKGGFGEVYKGKLANGQEIAVKRLCRNSQQGTLEFKNEVVLVAKLQHRNLVKLLGFCITGKEKILVYEFLCNSSLDRFLNDSLKRASLDWELRFRIIIGIARGLLYLHEDSRLKIIHRDLKSSNILLDQAMNAKISDFGLAKLFAVDQTQGDTNRIVGTYGYMAPEYAMAGQFSVKSDVYSFGVMVLEIVSGQLNSFFGQQDEGLLHRAWRLWNEDATLELVDPLLGQIFSSEEVKMSIHIGLLCIQEDATTRPKMASIVAALHGQSVTLPLPNPPHFLTFSAVTDATSNNHHSHAGNERQQRGLVQCNDAHTGTMNITEVWPR